MNITQAIILRLAICIPILYNLGTPTATPPAPAPNQPAGPHTLYLPSVNNNVVKVTPTPTPSPTTIPPTPGPAGPGEWAQLGHDPQRTNATATEVDPPYCYAWKWYGAPLASRLQPVVSGGRLFIGSLDGALYARDASTGTPLWNYKSGGPIRNSAGVAKSGVIFSSYDGYTYALNVQNGALIWKTQTGSSATAPLIDDSHSKIYVASTNGNLVALDSASGKVLWTYSSGAAILTSPSLSQDGQSVFLGNEAVQAISVNANSGSAQWTIKLQGQSLADRYPVVAGSTVSYRSQPLYFFHDMLKQYGDDILNRAGSVNSDWGTDWANVRTQINSFLTTSPQFQTFFVLNAANGSSVGTAPVLYTTGNNSTPTPPVFANNQLYVAYRARHGIQTDGGTIHVATQFDAELGSMNLSSLDITGLKASTKLAGQPQFRMTSDEGAMLTMSGNILLVDNWERLGGINVSNGNLIPVGIVSADWPECNTQCSPGGINAYFPMSGKSSDPAYPFPSPRTGEGHSKGGAVVANGMIYWRVIEAGLAGISHSSGGACADPRQWTDSIGMTTSYAASSTSASQAPTDLSTYVTTDRTQPVQNPSSALVTRLRAEISSFLQAANGNHLMPYYLERGMSEPQVWPYTYWNSNGKTGLAVINYTAQGNVFWYDPGELLYTMAMAYPYLDSAMQGQVKTYMVGEMGRYPPFSDLPFSSPPLSWEVNGSPRELFTVPFRTGVSTWPPPAANLSTIYGLWLWSKNTGDYSYAISHWAQAQSLYSSKKTAMRYYADLAGVIGYYRLAKDLTGKDPANSATYNNAAADAMTTATNFMQNGITNFAAFVTTANADFLDPREINTGWSAPVFYGLTPEVGAYLAEQLSSQPQNLLKNLETLNSAGVGLLWWYITRVGTHAEEGETDYLSPLTAWSHFLAHAYIVQDSQAQLSQWLDRPWTPGDLYSLQKIVAAIQAK